MQFEKAYLFMVNKLETGLPPYLTYHNAEHTKNVVKAIEHLAGAEGISGDELVLLKTAALFHDAGFLYGHHGHEEISCGEAQKYLPDFGYTKGQIEDVCQMIMATKLPQSPENNASKLLCDADLYYIGTEQYTEFTEKLFSEFKKLGIVKTKMEWDLKQIEFLSAHTFFTDTAIGEGEFQKQANLQKLKARLETTLKSPNGEKPIEILQDMVLILVGAIIAGYALKGFLVPNHFFDGGITGVSLLVHELYHLNLGIVIVLLNLPLITISFFTVGHRFAYRTFVSVVLMGTCLLLLPDVALTSDKLLVSIFGGGFLGIGIGLVMRAGAALDGIEVFALYTLKRTSFTITEIILAINILIFSIAAFKFGFESALYSVLTYFAATRCIDYVVEGIQAYTGVTIISAKSEIIKYQLVNRLGRGITVYKGERGFLPGNFEISADCDIIFTVITRLELRKLKNLVYDVDPNAFVFANTIKEASGGIVKHRRHH